MDQDTRHPPIPAWARPLSIIVAPYLAAGFGWAVATVLQWLV